MTRRLLIVAALAIAVATSACGSSADGAGSIGETVEVAAAAPGQADAAVCDLDRRTLESAAQMFEALTGAPPAAQADLLDEQLITELSPRYDITPDGKVVPAPASSCT